VIGVVSIQHAGNEQGLLPVDLHALTHPLGRSLMGAFSFHAATHAS
jgi:hypothetical protein